MGLELFSPDEERSAIVTAILTPEGVDAKELVLALRDRFGITVAGGHGELGARMFRIGHIGYYDVFDITTALGGGRAASRRERSRPRARGAGSRVRSRRTRTPCVSADQAAPPDRASSCASRSPSPGLELLRSRFDVVEDADDATSRSIIGDFDGDRRPLGDVPRRAD